jgi:hypothetical protein
MSSFVCLLFYYFRIVRHLISSLVMEPFQTSIQSFSHVLNVKFPPCNHLISLLIFKPQVSYSHFVLGKVPLIILGYSYYQFTISLSLVPASEWQRWINVAKIGRYRSDLKLLRHRLTGDGEARDLMILHDPTLNNSQVCSSYRYVLNTNWSRTVAWQYAWLFQGFVSN